MKQLIGLMLIVMTLTGCKQPEIFKVEISGYSEYWLTGSTRIALTFKDEIGCSRYYFTGLTSSSITIGDTVKCAKFGVNDYRLLIGN